MKCISGTNFLDSVLFQIVYSFIRLTKTEISNFSEKTKGIVTKLSRRNTQNAAFIFDINCLIPKTEKQKNEGDLRSPVVGKFIETNWGHKIVLCQNWQIKNCLLKSFENPLASNRVRQLQ